MIGMRTAETLDRARLPKAVAAMPFVSTALTPLTELPLTPFGET
jgi:hypothetical protein